METITRSAGLLAIFLPLEDGSNLRWPQAQRAQRHVQIAQSANAQRQRDGRIVRKCVYLDDMPMTAAAAFADTSGHPAWSPPV